MADTGAAPFARGQTYYGLDGTIPSSYGESVHLEGREHVSKTYNPANKVVRRDGGDVKSIIVRNVSGITLYPGMLCTFASGYRGKRVDGLSRTTACEVAGSVDDMLSTSSGVRNGDLFHLLVSGKALVLLSRTAAEAVISAGQVLYAVTAATSQATTAGRFVGWGGTFSAAETTDGTAGNILLNKIGRAISASTTADTGSLRLIDLQLK